MRRDSHLEGNYFHSRRFGCEPTTERSARQTERPVAANSRVSRTSRAYRSGAARA